MPIAFTTVVQATEDEIVRVLDAAAAPLIADPPFRAGDRVRVRPGAVLVELVSDLGIVIGYLPGRGGTVEVMCLVKMATGGIEQGLPFPATGIEKVA